MTALFSLSGDQADTGSSEGTQSPEASVFSVTAAPQAPAGYIAPPEKPKEVLEPPAGQYALTFDPQVEKSLLKLRAKNSRRFTKVWKSIGFLAEHGPEHPPLRTAKMINKDNGYCSFAENGTPGAWRLWWMWGEESSSIRVTEVGPTP